MGNEEKRSTSTKHLLYTSTTRPTLGLPYKKAVDAYQKVELNPLERPICAGGSEIFAGV